MTNGLSGLPRPYGVISAIDRNTGTLKFQVPHGDTPDSSERGATFATASVLHAGDLRSQRATI